MEDLTVVIPEVLDAVIRLHKAMEAKPLADIPECWEVEIDDRWFIAANGHTEKIRCSKGVTVDPFYFYVEFNGWPAGMVSPAGGEFAAGAEANTDTFIKAINEKISSIYENRN
jgi:hypothetical protein